MTESTPKLPYPSPSTEQTANSPSVLRPIVDISLTDSRVQNVEEPQQPPYFLRLLGQYEMSAPEYNVLDMSPTSNVHETEEGRGLIRQPQAPWGIVHVRPRWKSVRRPRLILTVPSPDSIQRRRSLYRMRVRARRCGVVLRESTPQPKQNIGNQSTLTNEGLQKVAEKPIPQNSVDEGNSVEMSYIGQQVNVRKPQVMKEFNRHSSFSDEDLYTSVPAKVSTQADMPNHVDSRQATIRDRQEKVDQIVEAFVKSIRELRIDDKEGHDCPLLSCNYSPATSGSYLEDAELLADQKEISTSAKPGTRSLRYKGLGDMLTSTRRRSKRIATANAYFPDFNTARSLHLVTSSCDGSNRSAKSGSSSKHLNIKKFT